MNCRLGLSSGSVNSISGKFILETDHWAGIPNLITLNPAHPKSFRNFHSIHYHQLVNKAAALTGLQYLDAHADAIPGLEIEADDVRCTHGATIGHLDEALGLDPGNSRAQTTRARAVALAARREGLVLDPVYSGKALAGLLDLARRREFSPDENIVFLHTGGSAALFGYLDDIL